LARLIMDGTNGDDAERPSAPAKRAMTRVVVRRLMVFQPFARALTSAASATSDRKLRSSSSNLSLMYLR